MSTKVNKILIADSSKTVNAILSDKLSSETSYEILLANTMHECTKQVAQNINEILLVVTCVYLSGSNHAEHIDFLVAAGVPVVVLTGDFSEKKHKALFKKRVSDYYIKESEASLNQAVNGIKKMIKNRKSKVLIVDEDRISQIIYSDLLERQLLTPVNAKTIEEAYHIIETEKDIKLLLCAQRLAMELVKKVRISHKKDELSIVVVAQEDEKWEKAKFLKYGINDYMQKPIENEEFSESIESQLESIDLFKTVQDLANQDPLTGLYNRRYFFDKGDKLFSKALHSDKELAVAMLDIDKFKRINDDFGHDVGDVAIIEVTKILKQLVDSKNSIVSRFGGEEFCVIVTSKSREEIISMFEEIRQKIEKNTIKLGSISFSNTISIGLEFASEKGMQETLIKADKKLYQAKTEGRNKLVY